jgi:predicted amidophosphoribosyltransferase
MNSNGNGGFCIDCLIRIIGWKIKCDTCNEEVRLYEYEDKAYCEECIKTIK